MDGLGGEPPRGGYEFPGQAMQAMLFGLFHLPFPRAFCEGFGWVFGLCVFLFASLVFG